jgi:hypothetical protein
MSLVVNPVNIKAIHRERLPLLFEWKFSIDVLKDVVWSAVLEGI